MTVRDPRRISDTLPCSMPIAWASLLWLAPVYCCTAFKSARTSRFWSAVRTSGRCHARSGRGKGAAIGSVTQTGYISP